MIFELYLKLAVISTLFISFLLMVIVPMASYLIAKGVTFGRWRALSQIEKRNWEAMTKHMDELSKLSQTQGTK